MGQDHDNGYKDIFSHPEIVRDLLVGFVTGNWTDEVDLTTLERVNASFVLGPQARHGDMVWKARLKKNGLELYILLEFQSRPDRWIALRMLVYVGMLKQTLIKNGALSRPYRLPPVLPIVLYNGARRWDAAADLSQLIEPVPQWLDRWQPRQRYYLIDERALAVDGSGDRGNLVAALFQMERARTPEDLRRVVYRLKVQLREDTYTPLRQSLSRWTLYILRRIVRSETIPDVADLWEIDSMLAETVEGWVEEWKRKGLEEGRAEGLAEGLAEGRAEGRAEGLTQGLAQGRLQGEAQLVRRQLERRFGRLPERILSALAAATEDELLRLADAVLDAESLEQLFPADNR